MKKDKNDKLINVFWHEAVKINWKKVNDLSMKSFLITIVGDTETFRGFIDVLEIATYDFLGVNYSKRFPLNEVSKAMINMVDINHVQENDFLLKNSDIIVLDQRFYNRVNINLKGFYAFNHRLPGDVIEKILSENTAIEQALCYNFPVFRPMLARKTITAIAIQNATWAAGTTLPNVVPGLHQLIAAPIEAASDFTVLTTNELRMVFILAGISGRKVNPAKLIPELAVMLSGAKGAEMAATQILGKAPLGAGVGIKTAVAFAFTYAIGEAVYLYMNYKVKIKLSQITSRMKALDKFSKDMTEKVSDTEISPDETAIDKNSEE